MCIYIYIYIYIYIRAHFISTHFTCVTLFLKNAQSQTVFPFKSSLLYASQGYSLLSLSSGSRYALRLVRFTLRYTSVVLIPSCRPSGSSTSHRPGSHIWSNHCFEFIRVSFSRKLVFRCELLSRILK